MLLFKLREHEKPSSGPIETLHGTWMWLRWTQHWQMGTSAKAEIDTNLTVQKETRAWDDGEQHWGGHCGFWEAEKVNMHSIYCCLHASQGQKELGSYNSKVKKFKKVKQEYQKQRCANFKTCNQWNKRFCRCSLGLFMRNGSFVEHKVEAVINA